MALQQVSYPVKHVPPLQFGRMLALLVHNLQRHKTANSFPSAQAKVLSFLLHLLANQKTADISTADVDAVVAFLTAEAAATKDYSVLRALSKMLSVFASRVSSSESIAQSVVKSLMLPLIQSTARTKDGTQVRAAALDCITGLLRSSVHASAIFSPLVVDVRDDGSELTIPNPLMCTLNILEKSYVDAVKSSEGIVAPARALSSAVDALASINRSNNRSSATSKPLPINISAVISAINSVFAMPPAKEKVTFHSLTLLQSLLQNCPRNIVVLWDTFLPSSPDSKSFPLLFSLLLKKGVDDKDRELAVVTAASLVKAMPLAAWLNASARASPSQKRSGFFPPKNISNLPHRVKQCLLVLLHHATDLLQKDGADDTRGALCDLASKLVASIPHETDTSFMDPCVNLISAVAGVMSKGRTSVKLLQACAACLVTSCDAAPMPTFLARSPTFIGNLLAAAKNADKIPNVRLPCYAVLSKLGRTTDLVLEGVASVLEIGMNDKDKKIRVAAATLLEQSLAGRDAAGLSVTVVDDAVSGWLLGALDDKQNDVRNCAMSACCYLNAGEWDRVGVVAVAKLGVANSNGRSNCFKTIGHYFARVGNSADGDTVQTIVDELLRHADDDDFNVRSMIQFAIGNLAQNVGLINLYDKIDDASHRELCDITLQGLADEHEKVVSSAIRAAGLLLVTTAVSDLNSMIELALDRTVNKNLERNLNSRQRYSINKHAWGACSALANVGVVEQDEDPKSLLLLARCLNDATNLKIRTAAITALTEIVVNFEWDKFGRRGCFGAIALACLRAKDDAEVGEASRELLWTTLSACRAGSDLKDSIKGIIEIEGGLEFLYGFCVSKAEAAGGARLSGEDDSGEGDVFTVVVQALQEIDWETFWGDEGAAVPVGILQKFNSRASLEQRLWRNRHSPSNRESRLMRKKEAEAATEGEEEDEGEEEEEL
jgi:hypothetical protein